MRLAFVEPAEGWSARTRAFLAAADALARRGSEVAFVCPVDSALATRARELRHPVFPVDLAANLWQQTRAIRVALESHFADVAFVQDTGTHFAAALALRRAASGAIVRRVPAGATFPADRRTRWADDMVPTVYLVTSPAREPATTLDRPVVDTVLGVEQQPERGEPPTESWRGPHLVCLGSDDDLDSVVNVMRAVRLLSERHPGCRLTVGGIHARRDESRIQAAAAGVADRVAWTNDERATREILPHASVAWVVSDGDAGGFGVLDAMSCGTAVLGRRTTVVGRYVTDRTLGDLLPELRPDLVAAATERLLSLPGRRSASAEDGYARAGKEFTERDMVNGFLQAARQAHAKERQRA